MPEDKKPAALGAVEKITGWLGSVPSLVLHTAIFVAFFVMAIVGVVSWSLMLLILTTVVSLEAIYLALFIQITVNAHTQSLKEVEEDLDEIEEDIDEIQEDVEEMGEDDATLEKLTDDVHRILVDLEALKQQQRQQ